MPRWSERRSLHICAADVLIRAPTALLEPRICDTHHVTHPLGPAGAGEIEVLMGMYSSDRAQAAATIGTIANITIAGITYISAVTGLVLAGSIQIGSGWLLLIPLPAWAMLFFQLQMATITVARTQSILRLESRLVALAGIDIAFAQTIGQNTEERLTNLHVQPWTLWPGGVLSFVVEPFILLGFTALSLVRGSSLHAQSGWTIVMWVVYGTFLILSVVQFLAQAGQLKQTKGLLL